ncbi:hypothetical protein HKI87_12g70870 [Chloropicon roscoffensis]|uniref:Uncharacterized protein n=1 Tax=Chloropicon roscoffensis TaxID=1461544 RepID=A0AAX4PH20_9CHLO
MEERTESAVVDEAMEKIKNALSGNLPPRSCVVGNSPLPMQADILLEEVLDGDEDEYVDMLRQAFIKSETQKYERGEDGVNRAVVVNMRSYVDVARKYKEEGNEKYKAKDYEGAIAKYTEGVEILSTRNAGSTTEDGDLNRMKAECLCNRSLIHLLVARDDEGNYGHDGAVTALEDASAAVTLDPTYSKAYLRKAAALDALGRTTAAKACRASAKRRDQNASAEAAARAAPEDNESFTDLADGRDPLDFVGKGPASDKEIRIRYAEQGQPLRLLSILCNIGSGNNMGQTIERARQKELRRGKKRLYYAISMRVAMSYLSTVTGVLQLERMNSEGLPPYPSLGCALTDAHHGFDPAVQYAYGHGDSELAERFYRVFLPKFQEAYDMMEAAGNSEKDWLTLSSTYTNCGLVKRNLSKSEEALEMFEKGAEYGNSDAMVEAGLILLYGACGSAKARQDLPLSKKYLKMALEADFPPCDYRVMQAKEGLIAHAQLAMNPNLVMMRWDQRKYN